jgi:gamma-glutamyl hydrolase
MSKTCKVARRKKQPLLVGILRIPHSAKITHGESHIMKSYVDVFERLGVTVLDVPYDTPHPELYMEILHGLVLPGAETEYLLACKPFMDTVQRFLELSLRPGTYFPIWGLCAGFEILLALVGRFRTFERIPDQQRRRLTWTEEGRQSRLYKALGVAEAERFERSARATQNHDFGISIQRFLANGRLRRFYRLLATATNSEGIEYVAAVEARKWPIYGVQWHPERQEHGKAFARFFVSEMRKCPRPGLAVSVPSLGERMKTYKCVQYPEHARRECYFFSE